MRNIIFVQFITMVSGFWYPILESPLLTSKPIYLKFKNQDLVAYKKNSSLILHQDACPHLGGSFSKGGWVENGKIHCPYHGFGFDDGYFVSIPSLEKMSCPKKPVMKVFPTLEDNGYYYTQLIEKNQDFQSPSPFYPPEHYDKNFIKIRGQRLLDCNIDSLIENLLDMLHISYVHSFGNMDLPLARNIKYEDIGSYGGRTTFEYSPNPMTISTQVGKTPTVIVENEFYLPTTTLTRVCANGIIKTVFTQSLPVSDTKTILFWSVYRNFWKDPYFPHLTSIGDSLLHSLMEKTIDEDASILSRCYPEYRKGFLTKYDVTIRNYRRKQKEFNL